MKGKATTVSTKTLTIPPAVIDIAMTLSCPALHQRTTDSVRQLVKHEFRLTAFVSGHHGSDSAVKASVSSRA